MEPATLLTAINAQQGTNLWLGFQFVGGEQGAFAVHDHDATFALKFTPGDEALGRFLKARDITERLRARGYPAASYRYVGSVEGVAYNVQEVLPGRPMGQLDAAHLPRLLALNDLQANAALQPAEAWPAVIIDSVLLGYEGYCVIDSLRGYSDESRGLLERLQQLVKGDTEANCSGSDIVHYDFNPANILIDDGEIRGVIDWDGAQAGDRAFDLATLLFYSMRQPQAAETIWQAATARSSPAAIRLYLAHMIVRQVDWSIRNHADEVAQYWLAHSLAVERHYLAVTNR